MNPTSIQEDTGSIPHLDQWVKDLALLRLWCRLATVALIQPLAWELPYAANAALKSKKERKRKERKKEKEKKWVSNARNIDLALYKQHKLNNKK